MGHDFYTDYMRLDLAEEFVGTPIHCLTATATPTTLGDVARTLALREPVVLQELPDRPNLRYTVHPERSTGVVDKEIVKLARKHREKSALVYCHSRNDAQRCATARRNRYVYAMFELGYF